MNKKTAIRSLNLQIRKLESLTLPQNYDKTWLVQTKTFIDHIFGNESNESQWIANISIGSRYSPDLIPFLESCIETIEKIGVYNKPKLNVLHSLPDWIISLSITAIFSIGLVTGKYTSDLQNIELKRENNELRDSITLIYPTARLIPRIIEEKCSVDFR